MVLSDQADCALLLQNERAVVDPSLRSTSLVQYVVLPGSFNPVHLGHKVCDGSLALPQRNYCTWKSYPSFPPGSCRSCMRKTGAPTIHRIQLLFPPYSSGECCVSIFLQSGSRAPAMSLNPKPCVRDKLWKSILLQVVLITLFGRMQCTEMYVRVFLGQ